MPKAGVSGTHTEAPSCACFVHDECVLATGIHPGACEVWGHISTSMLENWWQSQDQLEHLHPALMSRDVLQRATR